MKSGAEATGLAAPAPALAAGRQRAPRLPAEGSLRRRILGRLAAGQAMTARLLAEADGLEPRQRVLAAYGAQLRALRGKGWVAEHARLPGGWQRGTSVSYVITAAARRALEEAARPAPPAPCPLPGAHAWDAEAARRHVAGESLAVLAIAYGVDAGTVKRSLVRQGVTIRYGPTGRPRADLAPEWAAEAALRYAADETLESLCRAYKAGAERMKRILRAQGAELRGRGKRISWRPLLPRLEDTGRSPEHGAGSQQDCQARR